MQAAWRLRCAAGPHVGYCDATAGGTTMLSTAYGIQSPEKALDPI